MSNQIYIKFPHKLDLYTKSITTSVAGQRTVSYTKSATLKTLFQPISSERRVSPYIDNIDECQFYISHKDAAFITYDNRIQNVVDRYGNIIYSNTFEIINITKQPGLNGKIRFIQVVGRVVVENA